MSRHFQSASTQPWCFQARILTKLYSSSCDTDVFPDCTFPCQTRNCSLLWIPCSWEDQVLSTALWTSSLRPCQSRYLENAREVRKGNTRSFGPRPKLCYWYGGIYLRNKRNQLTKKPDQIILIATRKHESIMSTQQKNLKCQSGRYEFG